MKELDYSVQEFANVTGINPRTLSDYLAGRKEMLPRHRLIIAEKLYVEPEWL